MDENTGQRAIFSTVLILSSRPSSTASPSLSLSHSLAWRLCPRLLHSSSATPPSPAPLLRSHSGSLLLSLLDKPGVALIRHTNVIRLLYNHPFPCFHALSPNLRNVSRILFHGRAPDDVTFRFIYSIFVLQAARCSAANQQLLSLTRLKSM